MKETFIGSEKDAVKIKGNRFIDVTINNKAMHYFYEALSKYIPYADDEKERVEITLLIDELNLINDKLNKIK